MSRTDSTELLRRARKVQLIVLDVDGVLTDGGLYYSPKGEAMKRFDVRDGHGIVLGRILGLRTAILTARRSEIVEVRARELPRRPRRVAQRLTARGPWSLVTPLTCLGDSAQPQVLVRSVYTRKSTRPRFALCCHS